ncbi:NTP transferase domain-containing protein [Polymorphobacter sp.]|uniref:phosphocholine cytidylyltransferase family protein n=1 Tax=Polymorphobacter sp. TaxID=1909290 RepID=UPI003F7249EB
MQAIVLAAGMGTRLRAVSDSKPLTRVGGRLLLHRILDNLAAAGVTRPAVITGYEGDRVAEAARAWGAVEIIHNPNWTAPNGVSVRAAGPWLDGVSLLVMGDHLAEPALYAAVARASLADAGLVLGIDRRLGHGWVDEEDVTRVSTRGRHILAIGKQIASYDCYDCGTFLVTAELMAALDGLDAPGLSDGVRVLAARGRAHIVDVSAHEWIDIDDPRALRLAEAWVTG